VSPRVLIVDDEPSILRGLQYAFERELFEVDVAVDGAQAVSIALSEAVDLVVLDLTLPRLSGTDACRRIRAASPVPIIMLTARDSERDLVAGLEVGADDYMTKPFSAAELIARARALLRRRELDRGAAKTRRTVGAVTIDLVHDTVTVRSRKVTLTPSEFKILSLLASDPGVVFSRRQIMERLWESTHIGDEHACEVHVSSLRRKIRPDPSEPQSLVTVRGRGYMLMAPQTRLRPARPRGA
jgi:two-component system, OmpR family, response regulator RegX3